VKEYEQALGEFEDKNKIPLDERNKGEFKQMVKEA
jgi:hypothetical protein